MMQPQAIIDTVREAVKNIQHASAKDQYIEQLQHTNDLERRPEIKAEKPTEELLVQPELQPAVLDLQPPAPIASVEPISILAEQATREPTPLEKPIDKEQQIIQYTGKEREPENTNRPYLKAINLKPPRSL